MPDYEIALPRFHPKQQQVFDSKASEILFAGDTRAGKSYFVRRSLIRWCTEIPGLQTDIFRLNYDDVISENMKGETSFPVLLDPWVKEGLVKLTECSVLFVFNNSRIDLEHCSDDVVMLKHRGISKHVRVFSESTQILEHRIRALTGWVTMSEEMKSRVPEKWRGQFPKVLHVTNPDGLSSGYYRRDFVDCRPPYKIEKVGQFMRQYIPAFLDDNPSEDKQATIDRIKQAFPDKAKQDALINTAKDGISNWHAGGGEFFTEWSESRHVVTDFWPPAHWFRYRSGDTGQGDPAVYYWIAVSDGEPFRDSDGHERWFPRGARIFYNEWYISEMKDPSKGLHMSNEEMAKGIIARSEVDFQNVPTLTDSKPFQSTGGQLPADTFKANGVPLTQVDTGPGSRVAGWALMRDALIGYKTGEFDADGQPIRIPMVFFCACCHYARDYIPALPRHPNAAKREDAAEQGEATHACDAVRYGIVGHTIVRERVKGVTNEMVKKEIKSRKHTPSAIASGRGVFNSGRAHAAVED